MKKVIKVMVILVIAAIVLLGTLVTGYRLGKYHVVRTLSEATSETGRATYVFGDNAFSVTALGNINNKAM